MPLPQLADYLRRRRHPPKLERKVLQYRGVQVRHVRGDGIGDDGRAVAALGALAGRLLDANLADGAGYQNRLDFAFLQEIVEVGVVEGAVAEFLDDRFAGLGVELLDDVRAVERIGDVSIDALNALPAAAHRWGADGDHSQRRIGSGPATNFV